MSRSKLRLEQYYFPHQEVRANPAHNPAGAKDGSALTINFKTGVIPNKPGTHIVELVVELDEANSDNPPYFFKLHAFGVFAAAPDLNEDEARALASVQGAQVLLGAARDHLVSLTSRGPWGGFYLNIIPLQPPINR